jgi:hypothetical protein
MIKPRTLFLKVAISVYFISCDKKDNSLH